MLPHPLVFFQPSQRSFQSRVVRGFTAAVEQEVLGIRPARIQDDAGRAAAGADFEAAEGRRAAATAADPLSTEARLIRLLGAEPAFVPGEIVGAISEMDEREYAGLPSAGLSSMSVSAVLSPVVPSSGQGSAGVGAAAAAAAGHTRGPDMGLDAEGVSLLSDLPSVVSPLSRASIDAASPAAPRPAPTPGTASMSASAAGLSAVGASDSYAYLSLSGVSSLLGL